MASATHADQPAADARCPARRCLAPL